MERLDNQILEAVLEQQRKIIHLATGKDEVASINATIIVNLLFDLKEYRNICDSPEKLKLIDELYLERCEEINMLKAELE